MGRRFPVLLAALMVLTAIRVPTGFAGPPFLTEEPEPVPFKHWEFYVFSTVDAPRKSTNGRGRPSNSTWGLSPTCKPTWSFPLPLLRHKMDPALMGWGIWSSA
jgi:hypothetical protein